MFNTNYLVTRRELKIQESLIVKNYFKSVIIICGSVYITE